MYLEKVKTSSKRYMQPNVHSTLFTVAKTRVSLVAQMVKNPPAMWETWVQALGWEDLLEEGMVTHSSNSCLENPYGQKSGLPSVGLQRVGHD